MRDLWLKFRLTPEILPSPRAAGQLQRERQRATTTILAQRHFAPGLILSDSNASRAARHPSSRPGGSPRRIHCYWDFSASPVKRPWIFRAISSRKTWTACSPRPAAAIRLFSEANRTTAFRLMADFRAHRVTGWRRGRLLLGKPDFVLSRARRSSGCSRWGSSGRNRRSSRN